MKPKATGRRRGVRLVALIVPLAVFLSGCTFDSRFSVSEGGGLLVDIEFHDESGTLANAGVDCESFSTTSDVFNGTLSASDASTGRAGEVWCKIHGWSEAAVGTRMLADTGSTYTLTIDKSMIRGLEKVSGGTVRMQTHLKVTMPGDIVRATPGGEVSGNVVTYSNPAIWEAGEIVVEGKKSSGIPAWVWAIGALGALLIVGFSASRLVGRPKKGGIFDDGDPDDASVVHVGNAGFKREEREIELEEHAARMMPATTTVSAVEVEPIPPVSQADLATLSDAEDAEYSEEIGMVAPQLQGAEAQAVKRENALPPIPAENTQTSPIPGMPPRLPLPDELYAEFGVAPKGAKVPDIPSVPEMPPAPEDAGQEAQEVVGQEAPEGAGQEAQAADLGVLGAEGVSDGEAGAGVGEAGVDVGNESKPVEPTPETKPVEPASESKPVEPASESKPVEPASEWDFSVNPDDMPDFQTGGTPPVFG